MSPRAITRPFAAGAVVTSDYLPWARVTAGSFAAHHPGVRFVVLLVDEPSPDVLRSDEPFEVLLPDQVGLPGTELDWMSLIYDGLELCCALKPWLLDHLLQDAAAALYLDSDMLVCGSLEDVALRAVETGVVLSPHSLAPRCDTGFSTPGDDDLLAVGQFNAGFVAVGQTGIPFLRWWASKLARECPIWDPAVPLRFLDQRWLDLVVNYFPCEVSRDPGVNLARWNLHQRSLELIADEYRVDGGPLRLFHFSGFNPAEPSVLGPQQRPHPRAQPGGSPALARLVGEYVQQLHDAGWQPRSGERATPECGGITLTGTVRAAIRSALIEAERVGVAPVAGPGEHSVLQSWLRAPVGAGGTSWYLWGLWTSNQAVRTGFPRLPGADEPRYLAWSMTDGVTRGAVPPCLAGSASTVALDEAHAFVTLLEVAETLQDPKLLDGLAEHFGAQDDITLLLYAPGADPEGLVAALEPLLAASGLDGPSSPDILALTDSIGPGAIAPHVHATLTRRVTRSELAHLPTAADARSLRALAQAALRHHRVALASIP